MFHRVVVGVFGQIVDPETKSSIQIVDPFEKTFMGAMRTQNPRMISKVHMLIHNVPEYVRRTAAPLGPTSERALESQHHFFDIFLPQIQSELYELPRLSRTFIECCITL